ncbi:hypothetical protein ACSBR1_008563 [Camellia fascicularis]
MEKIKSYHSLIISEDMASFLGEFIWKSGVPTKLIFFWVYVRVDILTIDNLVHDAFRLPFYSLNFLVDIKGPALAFLPILSFEGGTRRNIPKFEVGTLIDVRVVKANTGMNPELSCTDATGKAAEYGSLKDGFTFESSTGLA